MSRKTSGRYSTEAECTAAELVAAKENEVAEAVAVLTQKRLELDEARGDMLRGDGLTTAEKNELIRQEKKRIAGDLRGASQALK